MHATPSTLRSHWREQHARTGHPAPVWGVCQAGEIVWWSTHKGEAERRAERVSTPNYRATVHPVAPRVRYRRTQVEVGTGKPGYRWAPAYVVIDPWTGNETTPMRRAEAWAHMRQLGGKHARIVEA